jgi:DNA-binding NtrC family response regulator
MVNEITIGLVDDDDDTRGSTVKVFRMRLQNEGYRIVDIRPFDSLDQYSKWINEESIEALIIDWRLNEKGASKQRPVTYEGGALVEAVHKTHPFMPFFVLTAYPEDDDVLANDSNVEVIKDRDMFSKDPIAVISKLRRASGRYSKTQQAKIDRVASLAEASASKELSDDERVELHALQEELRIAFDPYTPLTEGSAFKAADELVEKCESLIGRIEKGMGRATRRGGKAKKKDEKKDGT